MSGPVGPGYPGGQQPQARGPFGQGSPDASQRSGGTGDAIARQVKTPETKEFFKTSEFLVWAVTVLGILIAGAVVSEGNRNDFPAARVWLYVAIVSGAYIVSRGIAKAGTRRGFGDAPFDRGDTPALQRGTY